MEAYLSPVSHDIVLEIRGKHSLSDKYPGAIRVKHSQDSSQRLEVLVFFHNDIAISDSEDLNTLIELYNSLIEL